jgi:hypothetical protein
MICESMRVGERSASAPGRGGRRRRAMNTRAMRYAITCEKECRGLILVLEVACSLGSPQRFGET